MGRSHATIGAIAGLGVGAVIAGPVRPALTVASALVGAGAGLLPDLDEPGSTVARAGGAATRIVSAVTRRVSGGHRRATHSILGIAIVCGAVTAGSHWAPRTAPIVAGLLAAVAVRIGCTILHLRRLRWLLEVAGGSVTGWLMVGHTAAVVVLLAAGMITHTLSDDLTDSGTPLLWPSPWRLSLHAFHTGSRVETAVRCVLYVGCAAGGYTLLAGHVTLLGDQLRQAAVDVYHATLR